MEFHTSELDRFILECDARGTIGHPEGAAYAQNFRLSYNAKIDVSTDPFSEDYVTQQLSLYREISGRDPDQSQTEMTIFDVHAHAAAQHPLLDRNISILASHMSAISSAIALADLPHSAKVLDLGCGWGSSSEIMAYCGADVTAVDINPLFVELVSRRAERLNLPIRAVNASFEDFTSDERFHMAFFYECLHHAIRPWAAIENIALHLDHEGLIAFAGEPINADYWPDWGIRLDGISVYCIRKFGWFESGWSEKFLTECFKRSGFNLVLHPGIGLRGGQVGIADKLNRKRSSAFDDYVRHMQVVVRTLSEENARLATPHVPGTLNETPSRPM